MNNQSELSHVLTMIELMLNKSCFFDFVMLFLSFCFSPFEVNITFLVGYFLAGGIYGMPQLLDRYGLGVPIGPGTMV